MDGLAPYVQSYIYLSVFEWDSDKAVSNLDKHGIDFADAATVLNDEMALTVPDEASTEERYVTMGTDALGRVLVVVYTWRGARVRLISARKTTRSERKEYEKVSR